MLHKWKKDKDKTFVCAYCGAGFGSYRIDFSKMSETCPENKDIFYFISLILETYQSGIYKNNEEYIKKAAPEVEKLHNIYEKYRAEGIDFDACSRYARADWLREFLSKHEKNK